MARSLLGKRETLPRPHSVRHARWGDGGRASRRPCPSRSRLPNLPSEHSPPSLPKFFRACRHPRQQAARWPGWGQRTKLLIAFRPRSGRYDPPEGHSLRGNCVGRRAGTRPAGPGSTPGAPGETGPARCVYRSNTRRYGPRAPVVNDLLEDRTGRIWVGTLLGVLSVDPNPANARLAAVDVGMPGKIWEDSVVNALTEDSEGAIWMGMGDGTLYRRLPSGRVEHYAAAEGFPAPPTGSEPFSSTAIQSLLCDRKGRIWVGTVDSLYRVIPHPRTGAHIIEDRPGKREGPPQTRGHTLSESKNGDIWAGMFRALAQFPHDGGPVRVWKRNDGLPGKSIISIAED